MYINFLIYVIKIKDQYFNILIIILAENIPLISVMD